MPTPTVSASSLRQTHSYRHAAGTQDLANDHRKGQNHQEGHSGRADVEGDRESERDEEDRPEEGVGDAVGTVLDHLQQIRVSDTLSEEQPREVGAQDHVQSDRFGEQPGRNRREQGRR